MIDVRVNGYSLRDILTAPPKIGDQLDGVCRVLTLSVKSSKEIDNLLGQIVELYKGEERHFYGRILKRGIDVAGVVALTAYDPLIHFKRNTDDFYYKKGTMTATRVFQDLAAKTGVPVGSLANTKVVMPALYYQAAEPNSIGVDVLARTKTAGGSNFWFRFNPTKKFFGLQLFERKVPTEIWAFQIGVNLTGASYEESAEEIVTQVKLVNRETGKVVTRKNDKMYSTYGKFQHFEEVDKDQAKNMDRLAASKLASLSKVAVTSTVEGFNPGSMPMFFSGDVIYVEEKRTGIMGAYHIRNIDQEYVSEKLINISMDVEKAPSIPEVQYEEATVNPNKPPAKKKTTKKKEDPKKDTTKK